MHGCPVSVIVRLLNLDEGVVELSVGYDIKAGYDHLLRHGSKLLVFMHLGGYLPKCVTGVVQCL